MTQMCGGWVLEDVFEHSIPLDSGKHQKSRDTKKVGQTFLFY